MLIEDGAVEGARRVIDVSGDGANNVGPPVTGARDEALARGITINGLPIVISASAPSADLDLYYEDCVIGGEGAFVMVAQTGEELARTIRRKLILEISGLVPAAAPIPADFEPTDCLIGEKLYRDRGWDADPVLASAAESGRAAAGVNPSRHFFTSTCVVHAHALTWMRKSPLTCRSGRSGKELVAGLQRLHQHVHLLGGVVEPERRPAGRRQPQMRHQRLRAVMPGPHRHPLAVDHRRDVVRMRRPLQREREDRPLARAPFPGCSASSAP